MQIASVEFGKTHGNSYYDIVAVTAEGLRFGLRRSFSTEALASSVARKIAEKGVINLDYWYDMPPVYGSRASEEEQFEASMYKVSLQAGYISMADVPEAFHVFL